MPARRTALTAAGVAVTVVAVAAAVVSAATPRDRPKDPMDWRIGHPVPHAEGQLDAAFHAPGVQDVYSGQVIRPAPETWTKVRPASDYRVLLLVAGKDDATPYDEQVAVLAGAVRRWAADESRVKLKVRFLADAATYLRDLDDAANNEHADLIVTTGNNLVEPVAVVSANHAGYHPQQFLVLGAEVAEPTANIAAADWPGSAYLGEGLQPSLFYDPAAVTPRRADAALRAGTAAVLAGYTGVIVRIPTDQY